MDFSAASQGAPLQILGHRPHISKEQRGEHLCKEQGKRMKNTITPCFCRLLSAVCQREQVNVFTEQFRQWLTCTLTASKSTDEQASRSTLKKKRKKKACFNCFLCIWLFVICNLVICNVEIIHYISTLEERKCCSFPLFNIFHPFLLNFYS